MEQLGIGVSALILIFAGLAWMIARYNRAKKKQGASEEKQAATEKVIENVQKAKEAGTAARNSGNIDPTWAQRMRDKYRRK